MKEIISSLIAFSVLACVATSVVAQTREDELQGDYFKHLDDTQGGGGA